MSNASRTFRSSLLLRRGIRKNFADLHRQQAHRDGLNRPARLDMKNVRRNAAEPLDMVWWSKGR
jgi:hypothetical protein